MKINNQPKAWMRLYRRGYCLQVSSPKSSPLQNVAAEPTPTSAASCLPPPREPSLVKSVH